MRMPGNAIIVYASGRRAKAFLCVPSIFFRNLNHLDSDGDVFHKIKIDFTSINVFAVNYTRNVFVNLRKITMADPASDCNGKDDKRITCD